MAQRRASRTFRHLLAAVRFVLRRGRAAEDNSAKPQAGFFTVHELNQSKVYFRVQRAVLCLCLYIAIGIGYYHGQEGISVSDSIYFTIVTLATVGYGDITPHGRNSKIFTCVFVLLGISLIGYCLSILGTVIVENDTRMKFKHQKRVKRVIERMSSLKRTTAKLLKKSRYSITGRMAEYKHEMEMAANPMIDSRMGDSAADPKTFTLDAIKELSLYSFEYAVQVEGWGAVNSIYWAIVTITTSMTLLVYVITWYTVGYGDITPQSTTGRAITSAYIVVGYVLLGKCISEVVNYPSVLRYKKNELRVIQQFTNGLSGAGLAKLMENNFINEVPNLKSSPPDQISKIEFVVRMLQLMGKVTPQDILLAAKTFDNLDENGDGMLQQSELEAEMERAIQRDSISLQAAQPIAPISQTSTDTKPTLYSRVKGYVSSLSASNNRAWGDQGARRHNRPSLFGITPKPGSSDAPPRSMMFPRSDIQRVMEDVEQEEDDDASDTEHW